MGGKPSKLVTVNTMPIHPLPGSYGAPIRRKGYLTVYTEKELVYIKLKPDMTLDQLKDYVKEKTGRIVKIFFKESEVLEEKTLEELGIDEFSMIKATIDTADTESQACSDFSSKSNKSYSIRNFSYESAKSLPSLNKLDIDLSVYAAPEIGVLKNKVKNKDC